MQKKNVDYIVVSGYVSTGASIVCDLLKEVRNTYVTPVEFKLITLPDGLKDLENHLGEEWDWIKTGMAVNDYLKLCYKLSNSHQNVYQYDEHFNKNFLEQSYEFIAEVSDYNYQIGTSVYPFIEEKEMNQFEWFMYRALKKIGVKKNVSMIREYASISNDKERYFQGVHNYFKKIFSHQIECGNERIVLDLALTPRMASCLEDYFPGGKMIIVDRDPRDSAAGMIIHKRGIGPELRAHPDAKKFVDWYWQTRGNKVENTNILYLSCEELIYNYEIMRKRVFSFLNIDEEKHVKKNSYFIPQESAKKVGRWKEFAENQKNSEEWFDFFRQIEELLPQYCYDKE